MRLNGNAVKTHARAMDRAGRFHGYLVVQSRGTIALPPILRKKFQLDGAGAQLEVTETVDDFVADLAAISDR